VSRLVVDASTVLTWCFPDEKAQKAEEISELIAAGNRVSVPAFWRHEVLNALLVSERRKRVTPELIQAFLDELDRMPVDVDNGATASIVFSTTRSLCRKHGLTAYDAAYLELARRNGCSLATVDRDLEEAAVAESVPVI
jgi:predicted nucleic acid-binding protein